MRKKIKKGDTLIGPNAAITVLNVEKDLITIQNNIMHTILKVPLKSLDHLKILKEKND